MDPIPLLMQAGEWAWLEKALAQRHLLFTRLYEDLYGPQRTLRDGLLPAELAFGPGGLSLEAYGHFGSTPLPLYAAELARDPSGRFYALMDRCQAPSGHGYVWQNRRITTRLYAGAEQMGNVRLLLNFFEGVRSNLAALTPYSKSDAHVALLTPGSANASHFEHAMLSHFLGLTLVQGDDLITRDGRVWLKTLEGLNPVDVLLRRVDEAWCDPLDLRGDSMLGVVGLSQAARSGHVALANALGTGVLENLGLHAYLPKLAQFLLGQELMLPSPQTWWLGDPQHRAEALAQWDQVSILPIQANSDQPIAPPNGEREDAEQLRETVLAAPHKYIARAFFNPSLTPGVRQGALAPQRALLRVFLSHDGQTRQVMPGGLARVAATATSWRFSPEGGGASKDVWVVDSDANARRDPIEGVSGVTRSLEPAPMVGAPSRVVENLFWLGRYAERAEGSIRLFREFLLINAEETGLTAAQREHCKTRLLQAFTLVTGALPGFVGEGAEERLADPGDELRSALLDDQRSGSMAFSIQSMMRCAISVRDRLSPETWRLVDNLSQSLSRLQRRHQIRLGELMWETAPLLTDMTALSGLTWENMRRDLGWRFLDMGRRLERAMFLAQLLETTLGQTADTHLEGAILERLLIVNDAHSAFRLHLRSQLEPAQVLERLLQDDANPRSLVFQLALMDHHASEIPRPPEISLYRTQLGRVAFETLAALRLAAPQELALADESGRRQALMALTARVRALLPLFSDTASNSYFRHAEAPHHLFSVN
ncbi:hypothetical protein MAIT1_02104 [Magnetofaba australis IT-1]|uniref:Uncharacterized protein n=2 Tax=Magnetofaba TaxID=1472292 RepID=A0A1Y2K327_9PROT|nr:hypothetical protein MAIT1_02104 [Magnetofaba australis IT-1]